MFKHKYAAFVRHLPTRHDMPQSGNAILSLDVMAMPIIKSYRNKKL